MKIEDDKEMFSILSDKNNRQYLDAPLATSLKDAQQFIKARIKGVADNEFIFWAISLKKNPTLIGTICLWNFSKDKLTAELGYELATAHQANGYMSEAVGGVLEYGFNKLKFKTIKGYVHSENQPSKKLLKNAGFKYKSKFTEKNTYREESYTMEVYEKNK